MGFWSEVKSIAKDVAVTTGTFGLNLVAEGTGIIGEDSVLSTGAGRAIADATGVSPDEPDITNYKSLEDKLFDRQSEALDVYMDIAQKQYDISSKDKAQLERILQGQVSQLDQDYINNQIVRWQTEEGYEPQGVAKIILDQLDKTSDQASVKNAIQKWMDTGSVDYLLFNSVKDADTELSLALSDWADKTAAINAKFGSDAAGITNRMIDGVNGLASQYGKKLESIASEFKAGAEQATKKYGDYTKRAIGQFESAAGKYQTAFEQVSQQASQRLGTADTDILAQQRGQQLAGISQAYQESQKQLLATMSQRGLAGSGVEASQLANLSQQEAMAKAGALSQSYNQAIGLSDQRRLQQVGLQQGVSQQGIGVAGQLLANQQQYAGTQLQGDFQRLQGVSGLQTQAAEGAYQSGRDAIMTGYQAQMSNLQQQQAMEAQRLGTVYQGTTGNVQQNIANLTSTSGVAQGVYGQTSNLLSGAGQSAGQIASTAGSTAVGIQGNVLQAQAAAQQASAQSAAGIGSLFGAGLGAFAALSDKRLKTNIKPTGNKIGQFNEYTWDWIEGHNYGYNKGVIAQEVAEIMPEAVITTDDGYLAVNYSMIGA